MHTLSNESPSAVRDSRSVCLVFPYPRVEFHNMFNIKKTRWNVFWATCVVDIGKIENIVATALNAELIPLPGPGWTSAIYMTDDASLKVFTTQSIRVPKYYIPAVVFLKYFIKVS